MKKIVLIVCFLCVATIGTYANDTNNNNTVENETTQVLNDTDGTVSYEVIFEYDVCTVTVTITLSNGQWASATATNNMGNCAAAEMEATMVARGMLNMK